MIGALNPMLLEEMCERNPSLRNIMNVWCDLISLDSKDLSTGDEDYLVSSSDEDFERYDLQTGFNYRENFEYGIDSFVSFIGRAKKMSQKDKDLCALKVTRCPTFKQVGGFSRTEDVEFF